ncbi:MAG: rhomboid family intramembrane serine protease [Lachnospiraceae bacterium]|nr:rhomboid family intramembrane serine protease [Lachnospiraceae bacterium]
MIEQLAGYMQSRCYQKMVTNVPGLIFLFRQEMQSVNVVIAMEYQEGVYLSPEQYRHMKQQMRAAFENRGVGELHAMALMITDDPETARVLCEEERFCWLIDKRSAKLLIYEHQAVDFYGLKAMLEEFLTAWSDGFYETGTDSSQAAWQGAEQDGAEGAREKRSLRETLRTMPIVTILLVAANSVVFLICTWGGEVLYNKGELLGRAVTEQGEYYRIITSMFLHADTGHLFGNMLMLYAVGAVLEQRFGRLGYMVLYFLSGIGASAASVWYQLRSGSLVGSIGASGAVYGLVGALLTLVIAGRGRFGSITLGRILLCIAYSLYSGLMAEHIDNAAHIGGFVCGFLLTALLMLIKNEGRSSGLH